MLNADPPSIITDPSNGRVEVDIMQGFYLKCDVMGNPKPKIKWYFQVIKFFKKFIFFPPKCFQIFYPTKLLTLKN